MNIIKLYLRKSWLNFIYFFVVLVLVTIGFFLRLTYLNELPSVMHRDELAIAYNAYSILETGHDEWGEAFPIVFKSFGEYKLPGLIYSTIIGIKLFGLNPLGSRIVMAVLASLAIPMMFLFTRELFKSRFISLVATLSLVFSFWHISGSRNIYEPVVALSFAIPSYLFLFTAIKKPLYLLLSIFFFSISIWFYHTPLFIYPLLFGLWFWHNKKQFSKNIKKWWVACFVLVLVMTSINFFVMTKLNKSRSEVTIFASQELKDTHQTRMHKYWLAGIPLYPSFIGVERSLQIGYYFFQGYAQGISPDFVFFTGGGNHWHNLKSIGFGNINPILLPFAIFGLIQLVKNRKDSVSYFLLILLVLSPIPNAITVDSPSLNRLIDFHFLLLVVSAFGFYSFFTKKLIKNKTFVGFYRFILLIVAVVYFVLVGQFLISYFLIYNFSLHPTWNEGLPELIKEVSVNKDNYDKVFVAIPTQQSHIFFLFYSNYPPQRLLIENQNQDADFNHVQRVDNIYFEDKPDSFDINDGRVLLITPATQLQENAVFVVKDWEEKPIWQGYELIKSKNMQMKDGSQLVE